MKFILTAPSFIKGESLYTTDFTLEEVIDSNPQHVILVPTLEDYHEVRGQLFLAGNDRKVVCIIPPQYTPIVVRMMLYPLCWYLMNTNGIVAMRMKNTVTTM